MPAEKNTLLRVVVPAVVIVLAIGLIWLVYTGSASRSTTPPPGATAAQAPAPTTTPAPSAGATTQEPATVAEQPEATPTESASAAPSEAPGAEMGSLPAGAIGSLRARTYEVDPGAPSLASVIGSLDSASGYQAEVSFTLMGAGVSSITLTNHYTTIARTEQYPVQRLASIPLQDGSMLALVSLAAREVEVNGQPVNLYSGPGVRFWREIAPGQFEALVVDDEDRPVLRITRTFTLQIGSFEILVDQRAENLTALPLSVRWRQYGPIDLPADITGYGLDVRRVRFGYLLDQARDPSRQYVEADGELMARQTIVQRVLGGTPQIWPDVNTFTGGAELVWLAQTSRYFGFAVHPLVDPLAAAGNLNDPIANPLVKGLSIAEQAHALVWGAPGDERVLVQFTSAPITIPPGAQANLSFAAYAGPLGRSHLSPDANPVFGALGLNELVVYNLGGICAFCTFQPLARALLAFLHVLHDYILFDWALAIMALVVCVRAILHPITRRAQVSMTLFSRKMQALAPKQQKIRERYKDDPKRMQQEMIRLMREEKVSYAGMLGCLPMFLQSPIWIALYAMLYFSFELRHEAAFFGVFQAVTGGAWSFLGDLSASDHFIDFGRTLFTLPLLGHVTGLNILPLLLGVVFFIQQKYLTPPPSTALTPEQQQQQKVMRVMTVVMFPVIMYNAPCGLTIYFITNSTLGIIESRWIRNHVDQIIARQAEGGAIDTPLGRKKVTNTAPANPFKKSRDLEERRRFKER